MSEIVLKKDLETYLFRFDEASRRALVGVLGRFAGDPELSFSWHDAALVCKQAGRQTTNPLPSPRVGEGPGVRGRLWPGS